MAVLFRRGGTNNSFFSKKDALLRDDGKRSIVTMRYGGARPHHDIIFAHDFARH